MLYSSLNQICYLICNLMVSILETKQGIMDKFSFLKERAIEALSKMGFNDNERVFKALKNSLSDESTQVRINAIEALMDKMAYRRNPVP